MIIARPLQNSAFTTAICLPTDGVGDLVYVTGNIIGTDYQVSKADPYNNKMPAIAVIIHKINITKAVIQFEGNIKNIYSGLTPGKTYYVDTNGQPTLTPPPAPLNNKSYIQPIGVAVDSAILQLKPSKQLTVLVG
jgi:hypothetical protein